MSVSIVVLPASHATSGANPSPAPRPRSSSGARSRREGDEALVPQVAEYTPTPPGERVVVAHQQQRALAVDELGVRPPGQSSWTGATNATSAAPAATSGEPLGASSRKTMSTSGWRRGSRQQRGSPSRGAAKRLPTTAGRA